MVAVLVGLKRIKSEKKNKEYTIAYLLFEDKETIGQACKDTLLNGHEISEELIGHEVEVEIDFSGRVQGIAPVMKAVK